MDVIFDLFALKGQLSYGENVTQLNHALQSAHFAKEDQATPAEVVAALLHDIGHLLDVRGQGAQELGMDTQHEEASDQFLKRHFGPEVTEPVRLHVAAKRYLCATSIGYFETLSEASQDSLKVQGGRMTDEEVAAFRREPFYESAVRLRKWDDLGKHESLVVAPMSSYRGLVDELIRNQGSRVAAMQA